MASIFTSGSWWIHSKSDSLWNVTGRGCVGGKRMPEKCKEKFEELQKEFGEPPDDLEWGYLKD